LDVHEINNEKEEIRKQSRKMMNGREYGSFLTGQEI
jgi:hypothetical protein